MDLKLGPAIKLCHQIERVKVAFYRQFANWSEEQQRQVARWTSSRWKEMLWSCTTGKRWIRCLLVENFGSYYGFCNSQEKGIKIFLGAVAAGEVEGLISGKLFGVKMWCGIHKNVPTAGGVGPCALLICEGVTLRSWGLVSEDICVYFLLFISIWFVIEVHYSI